MKPTLATPVLATSKPACEVSAEYFVPHRTQHTSPTSSTGLWSEKFPLELRKFRFQLTYVIASCLILLGFLKLCINRCDFFHCGRHIDIQSLIGISMRLQLQQMDVARTSRVAYEQRRR